MGSLNSQWKVGLQDIAYSLHLNIEGTVEDLKSRINTYFYEHEEIRTNAHYICLFPQLAQQTRQATSTHNSAPSNIHNTAPQLDISNRHNIQNGEQSNYAQGNSTGEYPCMPHVSISY
jgi:hypothetical protein